MRPRGGGKPAYGEVRYGDHDISSFQPFIQKLSSATTEAKPSDRAELARLAVLLFTALRSCHAAHTRYKDEPNTETLATWRQSVNTLYSSIQSLSATLHIFAHDAFQAVGQYYLVEAEFMPEPTLDYLLQRIDWIPNEKYAGDFNEAISLLSEFIRTNFTMEEVFSAGSE